MALADDLPEEEREKNKERVGDSEKKNAEESSKENSLIYEIIANTADILKNILR